MCCSSKRNEGRIAPTSTQKIVFLLLRIAKLDTDQQGSVARRLRRCNSRTCISLKKETVRFRIMKS